MQEDSITKLERFFSRYKSIKYKKRENILLAKEEPVGVYYLVTGAIRTMSLTQDGKELTVTLIGPHDIFPILWTLYGRMHQHTFQALTNIEVRRAPKDDYLQFIKDNPDIYEYSIKKVLLRLMSATDRLEATLLGNAHQKVASTLLFIAKNLGEEKDKDIITNISFTHQEIADMSGLARETVTIEIDKLKKKQLIEITRDHLLIKESLKDIVGIF